MQTSKRPHISVMKDEFLKHFEGKHLEVFFEGTVGAGGHAEAILEAHPEIKKYYAFDRDPEALSIAQAHLARWKDKIQFVHGNFADLEEVVDEKVDGFFLISESLLCN